jgi:nucleotide-binding universal stress UspA family protein
MHFAWHLTQLRVPWLKNSKEVVVLSAPAATPRSFDPQRLCDYLSERGVKARIEQLTASGEAGPILIEATAKIGSDLLVAGAFGHPRFQQFIFGGATRTLMQTETGPSLFLSH